MEHLESGMVLLNERIAFADGEMACPLDHGKPPKMWVVTRVTGQLVQLVPLSPKPISDSQREGCLLGAVPVTLNTGTRTWMCSLFTVYRWEQELDPPGLYHMGKRFANERVMPVSLRRAMATVPAMANDDPAGSQSLSLAGPVVRQGSARLPGREPAGWGLENTDRQASAGLSAQLRSPGAGRAGCPNAAEH